MIHPALAHFSGQRWSCCFKSLTQLSSPNERWRSNCQLLQSCMFQSAFSLVPPLWWLGMDGGVEMESLKSDGRGHSLILSAINHLWTGTMIHPALAHFSGQRWSCCFKSLTQLSSPNERWRSNCQLLQSCMFQSAFSLVPLSLQGTGHLSAHQSSHWEWVWLRPQGHEDIVVVHSCQADMWSWCTWTNAMKWTALLIQRRKVTMVVQNSCGLLPAFSKLTKI